MNMDGNDEREVEIKIIMPAALIDEHTTVYKVTGESPFELREKLPSYSKVKGVSVSVKNEANEPIKFLIARTIDIVPYDMLLRIDYDSWHEGIYDIAERLEAIEEEFEDLSTSGDELKLKTYSEYSIDLVLPLYYVNHGELVYREKGTQLYTVYKGTPNKNDKSKTKNMKAQINLDDLGLKQFEIPVDCSFLTNNQKVVLQSNESFVKIRKTVADIEDLISIVSSFIGDAESK
jgi:hypothetical protein